MNNLKDVSYAVFRGIFDSLRGCILIFTLDRQIQQQRELLKLQIKARKSSISSGSLRDSNKQEESRILQRTLQCCALNGGVFWLSLLIFYGLVLPFIQTLFTLGFGFGKQSTSAITVWSWTAPVLSATFSALWILPLFVLSKVVNCLWFQDIADAAYQFSRGKPKLLPTISKIIADMFFSMIIQALFLVQAMLIGLLPIAVFNDLLSMLHMCLLYSLYSFEYRWFNMGWDLPKRLMFIENHWPYFVGFGLPLAILTALPGSFFVSGCVFSILFPLFIISANEAQPVTRIGNYPLKLFSPVVALANALYHKTIGKSKAT
nr:EOG090X06IP [Cyclestheria hislopi]